MTFQKSQQDIKGAKYIKHVIQQDICDSVILNFMPTIHIKKITKTTYMRSREDTGEVHEMQSNGERNTRSLRKIFKDLRYLIATNFKGNGDNELFITLTYAENMQDEKQAYKDFEKFWKRLTYAYKDHKLSYIVIVEPQARGAWHMHVLLKSDKPIELNRETVKSIHDIWGFGRTLTERLTDVDHIGAYFIAYFTNAEIPDDQLSEYEGDVIQKDGKNVIKGERLKFYPDYMKIYRNSRSMKKPDIKAPSPYQKDDIAKEFPIVTYQNKKTVKTDYENKFGEPVELEIHTVQRRKK